MTSKAGVSATQDAVEPSSDGGPAELELLGTREQLRWFGMLWVFAAAAHYSDSQPLGVLGVLAFGLPVLAYPTSALAFGVFVAGAGVTGALSLPDAANHTVVSLFVALGFGAAALHVWATRRARQGDEDFLVRWFRAARTPVGLVLLVVYLFTVFDKINTAFFDPATSCAGTLLGDLFTKNGLGFAIPPVMVQGAAIGTVLVEATILALLAVPRCRRWGLLLGIGFHLVLAPATFWDFSTTVFALYLLFVPTRVFAGLVGRSDRTRRIALVAFGIHLLMAIVAGLTGARSGPHAAVWHVLIVVAWYVSVLPLLVQLLRACFADRGPATGYRPRPVVLLLVPLLVFVNGLAPYLGLKTVASFSMFSNLHTEQGRTNHLVPGLASLQVIPYLRDTVTLTTVDLHTDSDDDVVVEPQWATETPPTTIPWLELRRTVADWRDGGVSNVHLEFQRGGVPHVVDNALTDPELGAPLPWWQHRLLAFRALTSADGPDICRW
ncbi:hypothetical protein [Pseudonocardia spinosispora]|uniref:hypothetical protein n=1 Tax=Pseudonocardia spinosispora TaxID=103441 RepID=UPI0003F99EA9|nr:hypothetical protein [Pseudonocardia spinosispora]